MNNLYRITRAAFCSTLLLLAFILSVSAQQKSSKKVTLNVHNGTLEEILQSIMKQTSVRIVYNSELIQKAPRRSFVAKNEDLKPVMGRLLKGSNLTYVLQEDVMVVGPKEEEDDTGKKRSVINGQVFDDKSKPLPLVSIAILGTNKSLYTGDDGKFAIEIEEGNALAFSFVGLKRKIVKPKPYESLVVKLEIDDNKMDEVVVTGYQEVSKRISASSTFTLKAVDVKEPGVPNIAAMLQGKVPGLSVVNNSGSPNAVPKMRIRGTATLIGNANPIWVVDGVIRENPDSANPDNIMGLNPDYKDANLFKEGLFAKASLAGNSISGLNVNDIESITFLKDASATAIYGTSAANGVIVVTTKKGANGNMSIGYSANVGFTQKPSYSGMKLMNSQERVRFSKEIYQDGLFYPNTPFHISYEGAFQDLMNRSITEAQFQQQVARYEGMNTDWFDVLFQNGINMAHNVNLSGGNEKLRYYSSLSYDDTKGSAKNDWQKRVGGMLSLNADITNRLKLDFKLSSGYRVSNGYFTVNPLDYAIRTSRAIPSDAFYPTSRPTNDRSGNGDLFKYNIANEIDQEGSMVKNTDVNAVLSLNYRIIPGLKFNSLFSANAQQLNTEQYATERTNYISAFRGYDIGSVLAGGPEELASFLPFGGILQTGNSTNYAYTVRNSVEYIKRVFSERDQINILAGQEIRSVHDQGFSETVPGYLRDKGESFAQLPVSFNFFNPKKLSTVHNYLSAFASASYSFADKYVLNANIRTDASNRFGQFSNQRFLPVWSVAALWNVSDEPWLKENKVISALNIKASYGFQGNVVTAVGPDLIVTVPTDGYVFDPVSRQYILGLKSLPYPNLRWEKTRSYNIELNGSLFNSFANFAVALYQKRGTDVVTNRKIPLEYGIANMYVNGGNISNRGFEASLVLNPIRAKEWSWTISANMAKNINSVQAGSNIIPYTMFDYLSGTAQVEGQSTSSFYVFSFKGLDPKNGLPLFNKIDDGTSKDNPFTNYIQLAGKREPDIAGGLFTTVRYKSFSVGLSFAFSLGGKRLLNPIYNSDSQYMPMPDQNLPAIYTQRWRKPGDEAFTNIPAFTNNPIDQTVVLNGRYSFSRYYMYDHSDLNLVSGSFLRCRSMDVAYALPPSLLKRLRIKQASITATTTNLFVIADKKLKGQDPEIDGVGTTALPIVPSYNLGISISF